MPLKGSNARSAVLGVLLATGIQISVSPVLYFDICILIFRDVAQMLDVRGLTFELTGDLRRAGFGLGCFSPNADRSKASG